MEIEKIPFREFFEESIKTICEHDPTALAMAGILLAFLMIWGE